MDYREIGNVFDAERRPNPHGASAKLLRDSVRAVLAGLVRVERQVDVLEMLELLEPVGVQAGARRAIKTRGGACR
jgi:hypothetical protein